MLSPRFNLVVGIFHTAFQGLVLHLAIHLIIFIGQILFRFLDRREVVVVRTHDLGPPEGLLLIIRIAAISIQSPKWVNRLAIYGTEGRQSF